MKLDDQIKTTEETKHNNAPGSLKATIIKESIRKKRFHFFLKRAFDIVISLLLIVVFVPMLMLVTVLIKLTSRGPILYSQKRIGLNGRHFKCHKFRSMVLEHTEKSFEPGKVTEQAGNGILYKNQGDPRVTFLGKMLRKTSIDELPQLFNVLFGDMSIVGPRPLLPFMLEPYPEFSQIRSLVRPGITGLWQIRDRQNNTSAKFMMEHDVEYIKNFSFFLDLKIIAETPLLVLSGRGAY